MDRHADIDTIRHLLRLKELLSGCDPGSGGAIVMTDVCELAADVVGIVEALAASELRIGIPFKSCQISPADAATQDPGLL